jgi:integrase
MFRLLDQTTDDTVLGLRNRALFETLYGSGIRVSELTGLNVFDVDFSSGCLRVSGKGGRRGANRTGGGKGPGSYSGYRDRLLGPNRYRHGGRRPAVFKQNKGPADIPLRGPDSGNTGAQMQPGGADFTPRDPAQFRHPHAGCGCGPEDGSGTAGPQEPVNHPKIHPCEHRPADGGLRPVPTPGDRKEPD